MSTDMDDQNRTVNLIDLDRIVRSRSGKLGPYIPKAFVNLLKRVVHQDFINAYLSEGRIGVDFCRGVIRYLNVNVRVEGRENLPTDDKRYIFVSNHPLGAIDGVTLGWVLGEFYKGNIKYLVNDLLMNLEGLAPLCVPINKMGHQARNLPAMVDAAFSGDNHVVMFPAGLCSRKRTDGTIRDLEWSKSFIVRGVRHRRDVVPIHFVGENSPRFYSVARWCKRLHLPNFAMLLLPDEMYRSCGKNYVVRIGKPIPWQTFDGNRTPLQWAQWVQEKAYEL